MIYHPTKCGYGISLNIYYSLLYNFRLWGRLLLQRQVGVVVVSFPATEMTESRCRICVSAAHTKEMLDKVLEAISEVGDISHTKHSYRSEFFQQIEAKW